MFRKITFLALVSLCFALGNAKAQTEPEKKKIKVQLWCNGKLHPANQTITKNDRQVQIKAFDATSNVELAVTLVEASLVRNGQKVTSVTFSNGGNVEKLLQKAKNEDSYVFEIKQVLELASDMSLKPFTNKPFKVNYLFFDNGIDSQKVASVGAN